MMKKILIMAFAMAAVAVAQAASINWSIQTKGWKLQDGVSYAAQGTSLWLVDVANKDAIIAALKDKTVVDFAGDYQTAISGLDGVYGTKATSNAFGMLSESVVTSGNLEAYEVKHTTYDLCTLIIDNVTSTDTVYYNISASCNELGAADDSDDADLAMFSSDEFDGGTGWKVAQSTPEPTSGLLMLIGMAGLALRRRRA